MEKNSLKKVAQVIRTGLAATIVGIFYASGAQAAEYRVYSSAQGNYSLQGNMTSPLFGQELDYVDELGNPVYRNRSIELNRSLDSDYQYSDGHSANAVPDAAQFNKAFVGAASIGINDVQAAAYAYSTWGSNHASATTSGFTKVDKSLTSYTQIPDGIGGFTPDTSNPIDMQYSTNLYTSANSEWEELFQIAGGPGSAGTSGTFSVSTHIDGLLNGVLNSGDSASMSYSLTSFNNQSIYQMYAYTYSWDDGSGNIQSYWSKSIFQNGAWAGASGSGDLVIDEILTGESSLIYGDPVYLRSSLYVSTNGNGNSDFANTAEMTSLIFPESALVYALSGSSLAGYGTGFAGGGNGTLCTSLECVNNGFGGGGSPVPVPAAFWLFTSGLIATGLGARRKLAIA